MRVDNQSEGQNLIAGNQPAAVGTVHSISNLYNELIEYYRCAMTTVETKFNILNEKLSLQSDRGPIEAIKTRLKSPESILKKLDRRGFPISAEGIEKNIMDVAGVRIICSFVSDIYMVADLFTQQEDIFVIQRKDYIQCPKVNGYRSLHLIVETPVILQNEKKNVKVEVQFRTLSMDLWASLEHRIRYKTELPKSREIDEELLACANLSAELESRMEKLSIIADIHIK